MVHNFAKDTGDYQTLSKVDMLLIAAGVKIARDKGEFDKIRPSPKDLDEFRPEKLKEAYDAYSSTDSDDSDENNSDGENQDGEKDQVQEQDDWADVDPTR